MAKFHEHIERSLVKAITFRIVIIIADFIVFFVITGRYMVTLELVVISNIVSTILYFLHERVWNLVPFGKSIRKK